MNQIIIREKLNISNSVKPLLLIAFLIYWASSINYQNISISTVFFFLFIIISVAIISFLIINTFKTELIVNDSGIREKSLVANRFLKWENIYSVDVVLKTNYSEDLLKKEDYFSDIYIVGKKLIAVSDIKKDQLHESASTKRKRIFYLPFRNDIIEVLKEHDLLEVPSQT